MAIAATASQQAPPLPSPAEVRRAKAIERLNNLAWGSGLKIEEASHGRFAIVGKLERIEAIIERERS